MGHFKSFLLLPFKKNGEALIDRISFKEVFIVYSMCWILVRLALGPSGYDILHITRLFNSSTGGTDWLEILIFIVDYISVLLYTTILACLEWLLFRYWHNVPLKKIVLIILYTTGFWFLLTGLKINLQDYFLALGEVFNDNHLGSLMWNITGLVMNTLMYYVYGVLLVWIYQLTRINKYVLVLLSSLLFYFYYNLVIVIQI